MQERVRRLAVAGLVLTATPAWSQSIETDGDIETEGQLVSTVATGTAPLAVTSTTVVPNLNADLLDGRDFLFFAFFSELQDAIADLDNPDPPCFDLTHRFVDCGNGTVTDTATQLIWLKKTNCFAEQDYPTANGSAASLSNGSCGLTDGSRAGDWRLPTTAEWREILDPNCATKPKIVGNAPGDGTFPPISIGCFSETPWATGASLTLKDSYWSSSNLLSGDLGNLAGLGTTGAIGSAVKSNKNSVWPVRGGQ